MVIATFIILGIRPTNLHGAMYVADITKQSHRSGRGEEIARTVGKWTGGAARDRSLVARRG